MVLVLLKVLSRAGKRTKTKEGVRRSNLNENSIDERPYQKRSGAGDH
jgi:hypothetical protein